MQNAPAHGAQGGKGGLEGRPLTAREDGDIARGGPVAAAGHRAIDGLGALGHDSGPEALDLGFVGGAHLGPDFARREPGEDTVLGPHHLGAGRRGRQASDDHIDRLGHLLGVVRPGAAAIEQGLRRPLLEIANRQVEAVAQQAAGQLTAHIAEADEAYFHGGVPFIFN